MDLRTKITEALIEAQMCADNSQPLTADRYADAVMEVVEGRDAAIRELHQPYVVTDNPMDLCRTCDVIYPCATLRALGEDT